MTRLGQAAVAILLVHGAGAAAQVAPGPGAEDPFSSDVVRAAAWLHAVCFVDPECGWAVGDRGTIWHTADAGRTWQLQDSGVTCPLRSVWFLDRRTGWAAGGASQPLADASRGVLLWTDDGGERWQRDPRLAVPALAKVRFFDPQRGWAIGEASALFPSGVLTTDDGGRHWNPLPGAQRTGWTAADLVDPQNGAVAGPGGSTAVVRAGALAAGRTPPLGSRTLRDLRLVPPTWGWLAGDGGLVMLTGDAGMSWQSPPGGLPLGDPRDWDLAAVAVRGASCWVAGTPGSRVFFTPDAGQSWTALATGQNLPLAAMTFLDERRGWAVGALGTILATTDGGRTWVRQRACGLRAAVLGLYSRGEDVPLEPLVRLAGDEGYLAVVEVLNRHAPSPQDEPRTLPERRLREARLATGASGTAQAWAFPLGPVELKLGQRDILKTWDQANDGRGYLALQAHLVRQIRLWRPEVILTHAPSPRGDRPRDHLLNQLVLDAVAQAADPTSYPNQLTHAGLQTWQTKKVYATLAPGEEGSIEVSAGQMSQWLGRSLGEVAAEARELLSESSHAASDAPPETVAFELLLTSLREKPERDDFFAGIPLPPGSEARRPPPATSPQSPASLHQMAERRRNVRMILRHAEKTPDRGFSLLARANDLAAGMAPGDAGRVLYQLGEQFRRTGRWTSAAQTWAILAERYPEHPLAAPAEVWLVQYYASAEAAWRQQGSQRRTTGGTLEPTASTLSIDASKQENRYEQAAHWAKRLEQTWPERFAEPDVRFPLAVADRMRGFPRQSQQFLETMGRRLERDAWRQCAEGELWLGNPRGGQPPKPVVVCARAAAKPRLDGRLDEPVWQRAQPAALGSPAGDDAARPASVRLAYDAEFLYLAVECRKAPGASYPQTPGPRPRDGDLADRDRVDVLLDLDRDGVTYYRLTIDHRGWTGEGCWGDRTWDPTWFVAAGPGEDHPSATPTRESAALEPNAEKAEQNEQTPTPEAPPETPAAQAAAPADTWTAEAAIPLEQLTGRFPKSQDVWAVGLQRITPGVGFQSWSAPASPDVTPEGFGYLVFE